jgi:hypothetical protein
MYHNGSTTARRSVKLMTGILAINTMALLIAQFICQHLLLQSLVIGVLSDALTDTIEVAINNVTAEDKVRSNSRMHDHIRQ